MGRQIVTDNALNVRIRSAHRGIGGIGGIGGTGRARAVITTAQCADYRFVADVERLPLTAVADSTGFCPDDRPPLCLLSADCLNSHSAWFQRTS